jgi:hypothetical protein
MMMVLDCWAITFSRRSYISASPSSPPALVAASDGERSHQVRWSVRGNARWPQTFCYESHFHELRGHGRSHDGQRLDELQSPEELRHRDIAPAA